MKHEEDFGMKAQWHFTATSHGKSTCDAICVVGKSATRLASLKEKEGERRVINTALEMCKFCKEKLSSSTLTIMYVNSEFVQQTKTALTACYKRFKTIPGTRKYHLFSTEDSVMTMKLTSTSNDTVRYNCFLEKLPGLHWMLCRSILIMPFILLQIIK